MDLKQRIIAMAGIMSISGHEAKARPALTEQLGDVFDEIITDAVGSHLCIRRCGRPDAPKILIDAHFDEIGMMVTEILEDGFLRVINVGGIDTRILQAAELLIYGTETIYGVVAATPPHLLKPGEGKKLKPVNELLIDTGYTKEEVEKIVRIGTPVGFVPHYVELLDNKLAGKGMDNKSCAAAAVHALAGLDRAEMAGDVYLLLAAQEETTMVGAATGALRVDPDYALVVDVTHGKTPDTKSGSAFPLGGGNVVSVSATTDRRLTKRLVALLEEKEIKFTRAIEASSTGTDATVTQLVGCGIPTAVASLPLRSMHTYFEMLSLDDAEELVKLIAAFVCDEKIAEVFAR
ncbi:MAG: M20/M25/M40 family metallo-hydrolase [Clostridia bacterium]|nr:M20/M25/M40 family metallo-hydrolase [Clostridia bacterium]